MYIQFVCHLDFQSLKIYLENHSSCHKVNFRKKHILAIFRIKYDCAKFHVKSIFLSEFMQGAALVKVQKIFKKYLTKLLSLP